MKKRTNPWNPRSSGYDNKKGKTKPFYKQNRWTVASKRWRNANPICCVKGCHEVVVTAKFMPYTGVTDHIIPIEEEGAGFDKRNFQSMCTSHHNKKSRLEQIYGPLYEHHLNEKDLRIPRRDTDNSLIPIIGRGGGFINR
jgi:5-methylcytosine-specific restriction endonuclease McrA